MNAIELKFLDAVRILFFDVAKEKIPSIDYLDFYTDHKYRLDKEIGDLFVSLRGIVRVLELAVECEDSDAILTALVVMRVFSMDMSSCFDNIDVDIERLFSEVRWSELPDGYKLPNIYVDKYLEMTDVGDCEFVKRQFFKK